MTREPLYYSRVESNGSGDKMIPFLKSVVDLGQALVGLASVVFGLWLMVKTKNRRKKNGHH